MSGGACALEDPAGRHRGRRWPTWVLVVTVLVAGGGGDGPG